MDSSIKAVVSRPAIVKLENAEVIKNPEVKSGENGNFVTMRIKFAKDLGKKEYTVMTVNAYDEWVVRITEKMNLRKGDFVSGTCFLSPYSKLINCYDQNGNPMELVNTYYSLKVCDLYLSCFQNRKEESSVETAAIGTPSFDFNRVFGG